MVKIEHYTVLRCHDSKKYLSNVLVLEYSFNSASSLKFQFFQINKQVLELYANLAPSPSSCQLRALRLNSLEIALQPIPGYSFLTYCY